MYYENEKNEFVNKPLWNIATNGTNLIDIFNLPHVDFTNTISNDIVEIYNLLGIEAAREALINEITPVGKEIQKLLKDKSHLKNILKKGSEKANIIAELNSSKTNIN